VQGEIKKKKRITAEQSTNQRFSICYEPFYNNKPTALCTLYYDYNGYDDDHDDDDDDVAVVVVVVIITTIWLHTSPLKYVDVGNIRRYYRTDQIYPCKARSSIHVQENTIHCIN
ncbi:hypothetical protein GQX74_001049, partial [Glossina fuscipes]